MKGKIYISVFLFLISSIGFSQNTVGTLSNQKDENSFFLIYPNKQSSCYLIDACGRIANKWLDASNSTPGTSAYMNNEGNLIRAKTNNGINNFFGAGGAGGIIECLDWDGAFLWEHINSDSLYRQHHDFFEMSNGNILYLTWKRRFYTDLIDLGFDTISNSVEELWFECVNEYNPQLDSIVWQWCSDDHLIQEFDSTKLNFGPVAESAERININYQDDSFGRRDWIHANSVSHNDVLDQISISCRNFSEVWIIDHSTSTLEAKGSTGGSQGVGGDLLHRFGNPAAYNNGGIEDQTLFRPHDGKWILQAGSKYESQFLVYNNHLPNNTSNAVIYDPKPNGEYTIENGQFLPSLPTRYIAPTDTIKMYSTAGSNIQILENGNFFICAARQGRILELTDDEEIIWEYLIPLRNGFPIEQGTTLNTSDNFNFKSIHYSKNHPALVDRDLMLYEYLEINPSTANCGLTNSNELLNSIGFSAHNTIVKEILILESLEFFDKVLILDSNGRKVKTFDIYPRINHIDLSNLGTGLYTIVGPTNLQNCIRIFKS